MSYDLQLLPRDRAAELLQRYDEQDADSLEINPGPMVPEREEWKRRLKDALIAEDPRLSEFPRNFQEIARLEGITEDRARVRYRDIELNLPEEDSTGIQVSIFDDTAFVAIPYWHQGTAAATQVFRQVWRYLEILESVGTLSTHDPQLERMLNLASDFEAVVDRYLGVAGRIPEIIAQVQPKRPWWKFW